MMVSNGIKGLSSQVLLSGSSFIISLGMLKYSDQHEYAAYVVYFSILSLASGLQNAYWISPLFTFSSRLSLSQILEFNRAAYAISIVIAVVTGIGASKYLSVTDSGGYSWINHLVIPVSFLVVLVRDARRAMYVLSADINRQLRLDSIGFLGVVIGLTVLVYVREVSLLGVLLASTGALAISTSTAGSPNFKNARLLSEEARTDGVQDVKGEVSKCAKWALPGVLTTWAFSSAYWIILDYLAGRSLVAELAALRLLFTPVGLSLQSWVTFARKRYSAYGRIELVEDQAGNERIRSLSFTLVVIFGLLVWLILTAWPEIYKSSLDREQQLIVLLIWTLYFSIQWLRTVESTISLTTVDGYKPVFWSGVFGGTVCYIVFGIMYLFDANMLYCIVGLVISELLMLIHIRCGRKNEVNKCG